MSNNNIEDYFSDKPEIVENYEKMREKISAKGNSIEFRDSYLAKKLKIIDKLEEMASTAYAKRDISMFESLEKGIDAVIFSSETEMYALYSGIVELKKLKRDLEKDRKALKLGSGMSAFNKAGNT